MVNITNHSAPPLNKHTIDSLNKRVDGAKSKNNILTINNNRNTINITTTTPISIPALIHPVQKGQKMPLETNSKLNSIRAAIGWNVINPSCDVDVSAFLLNSSGKVIGDDWFVFYGQTKSPDKSTSFHEDSSTDREYIRIDLSKVNYEVKKIIFVLTINEALEKGLNFSMLKDAYVRIINEADNTELVSFMMTDYYSNVTSMMIGEVYLHNGLWKFNAIGNGVAQDLAGLCNMYGVQVV